MKKFVSLFLVAAILLQQVVFVGVLSPVAALGTIIDPTIPITGGTTLPLHPKVKPTPTPVPGDPTHVDVTPTPTPSIDSDGLNTTTGKVQLDGDRAVLDDGRLKPLNNADSVINTNALKAEKQMRLTADIITGMPKAGVKLTKDNTIFIDWNRVMTNCTYFQYTRPTAFKDNEKIYYQISLYPYNNDDATRHNPTGLLDEGVIARNSTSTTMLDFNKVAPRRSEVMKNFVTPELLNAIKQDLPAGKKTFEGKLLDTNSISTRLQVRSNAIANAKKANLKKTLSSFAKVSNNIAINKNTTKALPKEYATSMRTIMESIAIPKTMYKFYVRVFAEDEKGRLSGLPSNGICVYYGEPGYKGDVKQLAQKMDSKPAADKQKGEVFLDWNDTVALKKVMFCESGITRGSNFAYVYYQVTTQKPDNSLEHLLNPTGLVYSKLLTANSWFPIDFTTFAVKTNNVSQRLIYYVRAVNVYYDPDNIATVTASVSSPLTVVYGEPYKPGSVSQTPTDDWSTTIDIQTPNIQFVQYTAPDNGRKAGDAIIVTKIPDSGPFDLHVGQKETLSHLHEVLVQIEEDKSWFEKLGDFFSDVLNGICKLVNSISTAWADIQAYAVKGLGTIGIPESVGGFLVNAALMAAGIPPTLPNIDDLKNIGKGSLTKLLVDQAGGYIPEDIAGMVVDELVGQAEKVANQTMSGLPEGGMDSLNGCVKPDPDFFCRNATITFTVSNPYDRIIPPGEFDLKTLSDGRYEDKSIYILKDSTALFNPERIRYPALQPGQKMNMTISLEEVVSHYEQDGKRYYYKQTDVNYLSKYPGVVAVVSGLKPNIPDAAELYSTLGLDYDQRAYIDFRTVINTPLPYIFGKADVNSAKNEVESNSVFVSVAGNDNNSGMAGKPFKTLNRAAAAIGKGGTVLVGDGTYEANEINISKEGITIFGNGENVIIKTPASTQYAFNITAKNVTIKGVSIYGSVKSTAERTLLEDLKVIFTKGCGILLEGSNFSMVKNSEVVQTGNGRRFSDMGIYGEGVEIVVESCSIHDVNTGVSLNSRYVYPACARRTNVVRNSTIYSCTTGLRLVNKADLECDQEMGYDHKYSSLFEPFTLMADGCNIYKCKTGVVLSGMFSLMQNCYIHDMTEEGVVFVESDRCGIKYCTLYNTVTPISFNGSKTKPNKTKIFIDDYYGNQRVIYGVPWSVVCSAIVEDEDTNDGTMVYVENNENGSGLDSALFPYMAANYFYCRNGSVRFLDYRPGDQKGMRFYMGDIKKWNNYVCATETRTQNYEADPKIDARGHSTIKDVGVQ